MTRKKFIFMSFLLCAVTRLAPAESGRYAIGAEQVAATVSSIGVPVASGQVSILADAVAATPSPVLQLRVVERTGVGRFSVRIECENGNDCLPFMASVQMDQSGATKMEEVAARLSILKTSYSNSGGQPRPKQIVIRNGSLATLQLDGAHVHIRIPVICLESGAAGQTIRATDKDHRHTYAAQVVENGLLQGRL